VIVGAALAGSLALWTIQRIVEALTVQSNVEARRSEDSERAAMLLREPAQVGVVRGVPDAWQPRVELDGTLQAQREASLGFKVGGRLARVNVKVGDRVRSGSVLAHLDGAEAAAQANAAEAQVRAAEASLALAQDSERRTLSLVQTGSFAEATGVQATQQRQLAGAQVDAARAQHALARSGVGNHALSAPFDGTITQAPTGIGGVVAPGQALFGLVDTSTLKLTTTVSEDDANLLMQGAECRISTEQGELAGRITAILATLDPTTRRVPVVAEFTRQRKPRSERALSCVPG
jgi:RND family efflux transporter MFP subunit